VAYRNSVVDAGGARSLQIFGAGYGSSPHVRKRKTASPGLRASDRAAELDRIRRLRGDRRAAALDVDADRMLIGASLRASRGLTSTWPKFSAATLDWRARATPVLLLLAFAALLATPSTITLSFLSHCRPHSASGLLRTRRRRRSNRLPTPSMSRSPSTASSPRSAVKRVLSTNCCRQSSD